MKKVTIVLCLLIIVVAAPRSARALSVDFHGSAFGSTIQNMVTNISTLSAVIETMNTSNTMAGRQLDMWLKALEDIAEWNQFYLSDYLDLLKSSDKLKDIIGLGEDIVKENDEIMKLMKDGVNYTDTEKMYEFVASVDARISANAEKMSQNAQGGLKVIEDSAQTLGNLERQMQNAEGERQILQVGNQLLANMQRSFLEYQKLSIAYQQNSLALAMEKHQDEERKKEFSRKFYTDGFQFKESYEEDEI